MPVQRPIAIDLFAGAGGFSLGFEQAGFDVAAAVEIDPIHCATHEFNFPRTAMIPRSARDISARDIRSLAGVGGRAIDCVFGGPPCQGFSLIGHRALEDPRNTLVLEFVRIVSELDAATFVFENVKGLTVGPHRQLLRELVEAFNVAGYEVRLPWQVLDAANYGVPQHRQRLILMGAKRGCPLPHYPRAMTNAADAVRKALPNVPLGPTCESALGDLPDADFFDQLLDTDCASFMPCESRTRYAAEMRCESLDHWHFGHIRRWNPHLLTSSSRTVHSEISRRRFQETCPGQVEPISRFFRLPPDGLSNTLRAGTDGARGAFTSPRPIHYRFPRCVTVREMARLHGFPDWFRFNATKWHGARQIGNAVAPPLARAIALNIAASIGYAPTQPTEPIDLGDVDLLHMDMSQAARYFGVVAPSSRRDRRSGAKKRKQHEIERERMLSATYG